MPGEDDRTPFIDQIVDEVLRGQRLVLFPPGVGVFALATIAILMGSAIWMAVTLPRLMAGYVHPAVAPLLGLLFTVPMVVVPALMLARGRPLGSVLLLRVVGLWLLLTVGAAAAALMGALSAPVAAYALAGAAFLVALVAVRSRRFRVFVIFQQRLRAGRERLARERITSPVKPR